MEYLGAFSIGLSWLAGAYLLRRWRGTNAMSISLHAASARKAYWLFAVTLTVTGGLLYWYMLAWFVPHMHLNFGFLWLFSITMALQFVAAWTPDKPGWQRIVHRVCAYGMAALMMPLVAWILTSNVMSVFARIFGVVALSYMLVLLGLIAIFSKVKAHYLVLQVIYVMAMQLVILAAAYA
jgi:hypothetical protein